MSTSIIPKSIALTAVFFGILAPAWAQSSAPAASSTAASTASCPSILHQTFKRLQDEAPQNLCQYAGKAVLVVNTASYCGFTKQYEGLEDLYAKYRDKGLVVLGFPSNDFGNQEPGDSKQIADFCYNTYGVKFPMFSKSSVKGPEANPLHAELAKITGTTPKWNFYKYLIDRSGKVVAAYPSEVTPGDRKLVGDIEKALGQGM
ncbi:glutathione peroxidase [Noviherbaspirillum massiliense]|uniref:glutathione peroxidase n=1 Tax=Noviherbaspirillum massiliense TaxID=1465823 RepID=UPI000686FC98|nr:glutathione peroxidase [Noviherbaspirillum massiliense]